MHIIVETQGADAKDLGEASEQRLRFALRRLAWLVDTVRVSYRDANGPRGGVDKQCQVQLHLRSRGNIVVKTTADDWYAALHAAIRRAVSRVVKHLQQSRPLHARPLKRLELATVNVGTSS
ncbi:MAG: HPF/RaiA family ribosome-associated protein [Burkholderiales bacterium]|nr:HPF/RaiA family ribosome-associated protein [Burkholderiales bacterium]